MNNELIDLISVYLQNNLKESLSVDENLNYKIAKYKLKYPDSKEMKLNGKKIPVTMSTKKAQEIVNEYDEDLQKINEKSKLTQYQKEKYGASMKSKRGKTLAKGNKAKGDSSKLSKSYWDQREKDEKRERQKPGFKNKPRPDSKVSELIDRASLQMLLQEVYLELLDEKGKKRKKKSKKKKASGKLSAKTKETLKKKAKKRGLTPGSVYREYRKGLAAWGTSGSRKGMSQHQWAHARVNSATPSKPWAVVKKSKAKKS